MRERRRTFSRWLAATFPLFFLRHWNGLFGETYDRALEDAGGTRTLGPQVMAAFLSAIIVFAALAAVGEVVIRRARRSRD